MAFVYSDRGVRYQKIKKLGEGSFGVVHLVTDPKGNEYVIKTVDRLSTQEALQDAKREVDILRLSESSLGHPNVVRYYESFVRSRELCILMEYAPNGNLSEYITYQRTRGTHVPEIDVCHKLRQMCSAIGYCHNNLKVIHRDIKPANVLIDKYGTLKLTDFGISKQLQDINFQCATQAGTPIYMPPEMMSGLTYTFKADMWMLGCVLYELMALQMPWGMVRNLEVLADRIRKQVIDTSLLRLRYSEELCSIVRWLLDRDASKRPCTEQVVARFKVCGAPESISASKAAAIHVAALRIQTSFRKSRKDTEVARYHDIVQDIVRQNPALPRVPTPTADVVRPTPAAPAAPLPAQKAQACVAIQDALRRSLNRRRERRPKMAIVCVQPDVPESLPPSPKAVRPRPSSPALLQAIHRPSRRIEELAIPRKPKAPIDYMRRGSRLPLPPHAPAVLPPQYPRAAWQ